VTGNLGSFWSPSVLVGQHFGTLVDVGVLNSCMIAFLSRITPSARARTCRLISRAIFIVQTTVERTALGALHSHSVSFPWKEIFYFRQLRENETL